MNRIISFREYFQRKYGAPVQRIPVDAGFSCPNRIRGHGCAFCGADGSRAAHLSPGLEIAERMYERHKLLTELLIGLGVSEETAREDACKIEHDLSVETFDAIRKHAQQCR